MNKCKVCSHKKRTDIEKLIVNRTPLRTIAKEFELSKSSIQRHKKHMGQIQMGQKNIRERNKETGQAKTKSSIFKIFKRDKKVILSFFSTRDFINSKPPFEEIREKLNAPNLNFWDTSLIETSESIADELMREYPNNFSTTTLKEEAGCIWFIPLERLWIIGLGDVNIGQIYKARKEDLKEFEDKIRIIKEV